MTAGEAKESDGTSVGGRSRAPNTGFQVTATPLAPVCATLPAAGEIGRCGIGSGTAGTDRPRPWPSCRVRS